MELSRAELLFMYDAIVRRREELKLQGFRTWAAYCESFEALSKTKLSTLYTKLDKFLS
jgi:hypothetical protein